MTFPNTPGGQLTYDGTPESRITIRNWQAETPDDPGVPLMVKLRPGVEAELPVGGTLTRNPDFTYSIQVDATEPE